MDDDEALNYNVNSSAFVYLLHCSSIRYEYPLYGNHYVLGMVGLVVLACMIIPTTTLNGIAISVLIKREQLKIASNIFLLNTSICDCFVGIVGIPLSIYTLALLLFNHSHNCILFCANFFTLYLCVWVSFIATFFIAVDRQLAIFNPFFYVKYIKDNKKPYIIAVAAIWFIMVLIILSSFFVEQQRPLLYLSLLIPPTVVYSIYVHVRVHSHSVNVQRRINKLSVVGTQQRNRRHTTCVKEAKVARLTSYMLVSLCVCYLPYCGVYIFWMVRNHKMSHLLHTFGKGAELFALLKCLINPILYYKGKQALRRQIRRFSCKVVPNMLTTPNMGSNH